MATFNKINGFVEAVAEKKHNLWSDTLVIALTNTPHTSTWTQLSDLTQIAYTNLSSRTLTTSSSLQTDGTYRLVLNDIALTATGTVATFRYIYIYNDTATNDDLIGYYDYGAELTLLSGQILYIDFSATALLQIA